MMGAGYPHLARINGWCALLCLAFLVGLFWLARRSWQRRERVRIKSRYIFDEHGRLVGTEPPNPDARECRLCGQPIAPDGAAWVDGFGDRHCHSTQRGHVAVRWHEPTP
jgi:hypothetical protein